MKKLLLALLVVGLLFLGCAQKTQEKPKTPVTTATTSTTVTPAYKLVKPGVLTVGMDATYPPFEYINETTKAFEGFDVDLMKEVAKRIGLKAEFVNVAWEGIIPGLTAHKYDCICSAMTITAERAKQVDFSRPYFVASQVIVVRANDNRIHNVTDLAGKVVGVQMGTTGQFFAEKLQKQGIKFELKLYKTTPDALMDLKNGRIDAVIIDNGIALWMAKKCPEDYKVIEQRLTYEYYGIAVAKDNPELLKAINKALEEIFKDGTYAKIYKKWFGTEPDVSILLNATNVTSVI
ncbi:basic amino acid ABC transporter substrate-binding protein [Archaeoglobus sp.]